MTLVVNGVRHELVVPPERTLLDALREDLRLTGTKYGCELGECGACTVLLDGEPALACLTLTLDVADRAVTTIEGLAQGATPHPLQTAFVEAGAAQCGYCTGAMLLTAAALLHDEPDPSPERIRAALAGNLCRCTGYAKIVEAVRLAAVRTTAPAAVPEPADAGVVEVA
jgi:carbon-monoxide dehydrogenase small subunit